MTDNPYLARRNKNKIGKAGRKSERRVAKKLNVHAHAGSGNVKGHSGDMTKNNVLIECKATEAESFRLTRDVLSKIAAEAIKQGKYPALILSFVTGNGKPKSDGEWVLIPRKEFDNYLSFKEIED